MADEDVININLALPKPIRFQYGDESYTIDGRISMAKALRVRQLAGTLDETRDAMAAAMEAATEDPSEQTVNAAHASIATFEAAADELEEFISALFRETDPGVGRVRLGYGEIGTVAAVIWQRAFGMSDDALEALGDDADPPTKTSRSTSPNGSSRSARRSAAPRASGSRSR